MMGSFDVNAKPGSLELTGMASTRMTVSYTHLDVYKRQVSKTIPDMNKEQIKKKRGNLYLLLVPHFEDVYKRQMT